MVHLPAEFPSDAAAILVTSWRSKSGDKATLAEAAWNILGFGLAASLGSPGQAQVKVLGITSGHEEGPDHGLSNEEVINHIETFINTPAKQRVYGAIPVPISALVSFSRDILTEM